MKEGEKEGVLPDSPQIFKVQICLMLWLEGQFPSDFSQGGMPHQALPQRGQWFPRYVWTIIGSNFMREKLNKLDMSVSVLQLRLTLASSNLSQADETLLALLTPPCIQSTSRLEKMLGMRVPVAAHQLQPPSALDLLSFPNAPHTASQPGIAHAVRPGKSLCFVFPSWEGRFLPLGGFPPLPLSSR